MGTSSIAETQSTDIVLRASGLPGAGGCWRKWAGQMALDPTSKFMPILQKHGFELTKKNGNGIGAAVGSACHEGFGNFFQAKIDGMNADPHQGALLKFGKLVGDGVEFEEGKRAITKDAATAKEQIKRIIDVYLPHAQTIKPARVEFNLTTKISAGYVLSGHPDIYEKEGHIRDMKFGRNETPYEAQLGAYRLMARSHGMEVNRLFVDWVPRKSLGPKAKPTQLKVVECDPVQSELAAYSRIETAMNKIERFKETGDEWIFDYNNDNNLCSKKWCPVWGTPFCTMGRKEKESDDDDES